MMSAILPCSRTTRRRRERISLGESAAVSSINNCLSFSRFTAEVRRGQSSSSNCPERTRVWSMRPSEESIRSISDSAGISMENTMTGLSLEMTACSTKFMAKVVLPIEGRPAMITKSEGCRPEVISSRSRKPVDSPVISPLRLKSSSIRSTALVSRSLIPMGPPVLGRSSAI